MSKINILVVASDNQGGVGFFRSSQPHEKLEKMFPEEFHVEYNMHPDWSNFDYFRNFNIIHIHKGVFDRDEEFLRAMAFFKANDIVTVMDIDDHWKLDFRHPQNLIQKRYGISDRVTRNLKLFDYVTTTTKIFANEIKPFNKNVVVFPNAIDPDDDRFKITKTPAEKLRIGLIMGSTHEHDLMIMDGFINKLPKEIRDKIEIVLCGFDLRGTIKIINQETGEVTTRDIQPRESVWYRYEKMVTDNYKIISPFYRQFLESFVKDAEYPDHEKEGYRRCWTKDMNHYYQHYANVDVLLAPLEITEFNKVKSQLKVIEAAFSHTAIIASDFGPYTLDLKNIFVKGGGIDETGNAILIDEKKNHKDWVKAIEKLVKKPELVTLLQDNLYNSIKDEYNLSKVTTDRANWYKEINKKK